MKVQSIEGGMATVSFFGLDCQLMAYVLEKAISLGIGQELGEGMDLALDATASTWKGLAAATTLQEYMGMAELQSWEEEVMNAELMGGAR